MLPSGICYQHNKPSSELQRLHFWHPALPTAIVPLQKKPRLLEMRPLLLEDASRAISNFQVRQKHSPETTRELITESGEPTAEWGSVLCWNRRIKVLGWPSQISLRVILPSLGILWPTRIFFMVSHADEKQILNVQNPKVFQEVELLFPGQSCCFNMLSTVQPFPSAQQKQGFKAQQHLRHSFETHLTRQAWASRTGI